MKQGHKEMPRRFILTVFAAWAVWSHSELSTWAEEAVQTYKGYELPAYSVLEQAGEIELREYQPRLVAEVMVDGDRDEAANAGFRILAAYIFGDNEGKADIAMTVPVTQKAAEKSSEKIAMTVPVTQEANGDNKGDKWVVQFMMPASYSLETLPKTKDARIAFRMARAEKLVAIRFSGWAFESTLAEQKEILDAFIAERKLKTAGDHRYAFYDDPFTLPWNRRNEIQYLLR